MEKPESEFREILPDGNLAYNGDFAEAESLEDEENRYFLLFEGGEGAAAIEDGVLTVSTEAMGSVDYSVQIVQATAAHEKRQ